MTNSEYCLKEW